MNAFPFLVVLFAGLACVAFIFVVVMVPVRHKYWAISFEIVRYTKLIFSETEVLDGLREENVIGSGGSGKVYRVHLDSRNERQDGHGDKAAGETTVVVKKLWSPKKLLVYEDMENGSLDWWLHRGEPGSSLNWPARLAIAINSATGLSYMHHDSTRPVIHRDVKSSNILLDGAFKAKIGDFGLARILAKPDESEPASAVCGTIGYIAPEYAYRGKVSPKVDVYSFGVVLLELTTGRRPQDGGPQLGTNLAKWARKQYDNGASFRDFVDRKIQDPVYLKDVLAVFALGVICTREDHCAGQR